MTGYDVEPMCTSTETIVISRLVDTLLFLMCHVTRWSPLKQTVSPVIVVLWAEAGNASATRTTAAMTPASSAIRRRRRPTRNTFTVPPET